MNDIYELADELANEIEESGKTRWSAKDIKEFFLSEGINLSLDEILQVWNACPNPVCASELIMDLQDITASTSISSFISELNSFYSSLQDFYDSDIDGDQADLAEEALKGLKPLYNYFKSWM